jgi:transposase
MISTELLADIRRLYYAEHWKIGTIATELGLHHDTVSRALDTNRFRRGSARTTKLAPFEEFVQQTLGKYPRLRATRIFEMIRDRGYMGGIAQLRRRVRRLRPRVAEAFVRLQFFPAEQAQVDWAHFGRVQVGRAQRRLSCFVLSLSYSRAFYLEFFFDQSLENFLLGHVRAFENLGGCVRNSLYDNLKSAVLERYGEKARFHPRLLELCAHYHFQPQLCSPGRGNEKGRVERTIRFIREGFFEGREFTNLADFNRRAIQWRDQVLHRPHPDKKPQAVLDVFREEQAHLLALPQNRFEVELLKPVSSPKSIFIRFDLNQYSIPPDAVGKKLTLAATDTQVRILDGAAVIASHRRSFDRGEILEAPEHRKALLELRKKAQTSLGLGRLGALLPETHLFLEKAFEKGESPRGVVPKLLLLLDDYGQHELRAAIQVVLEHNTPRLSSLAFVLRKRHTATKQSSPLPVQLDHRPELAQLYIEPPSAELYDQLSRKNHEDE